MLARKKRLQTQNQLGMSKKQVMVPSFETTAKLYQEHFLILRELKHKIDLLKQAYYGQMDKRKTWEQVDSILEVLVVGMAFLDFPLGKDMKLYLSAEEAMLAAISGDAGSEPPMDKRDLISESKSKKPSMELGSNTAVSRNINEATAAIEAKESITVI